MIAALVIFVLALLAGLTHWALRRQSQRDPTVQVKVPKPDRRAGRVTSKQAPELTRNERRRYKKVYDQLVARGVIK